MSDNTVLGLSVSTPQHPFEDIVAIDNSVFVAADSFIRPCSNGLQDPFAAECFEIVATAFCNDVSLYLPLPESRNETEPELLKPWTETQKKTNINELALEAGQVDQIASRLTAPFIAFVEGGADRVARWLSFHFSSELVGIYLGRASVQHIEQCAHIVHRLLHENQLPKLEAAIADQQRSGKFDIPKYYLPHVGSTDFPSELHLGVGYILSVYLRGWSYALGLSVCERQPSYQHHWLRASALLGTPMDNIRRKRERHAAGWFPWGTILRSAFSPVDPLASRDLKRVVDVFAALREQADQFRKDFAVASHKTDSGNDRPSESELLVLETLRKAGVVPRYDVKPRQVQLVSFLQRLGKTAKLEFISESVTSNLQREWARNAELQFRLKFRRSTIWDVFNDPGINTALYELRMKSEQL